MLAGADSAEPILKTTPAARAAKLKEMAQERASKKRKAVVLVQ